MSTLPPPRRAHFVAALAIYGALAVYGSLVPLSYRHVPWAEALRRFAAIEYLRLGIESRADWVANILLFVPIGFLALGALLVDRSGKARAVACGLAVVAGCLLASVAIEFTQIWFPPRTVSQNDMVAEMLGGALGVAVWLSFGSRLTVWLRSCFSRSRPGERIDRLVQAYLFGLLVYSFLPLDLTISPAEIWHKYREGKIQFLPTATQWNTLEGWYATVTDILVFIPVGMFAATTLVPRGQRVHTMGRSVMTGLLIVCGIEFGQLFVYSRFTSTLDLASGGLGIALGAWMIRRLGSDEPARRMGISAPAAAASAVAYTALLVAVFWAPFDFVADGEIISRRLRDFFRVPFSALYQGTEFHAVTQVLRKVLLLAPLGALSYLATNGQPAMRWVSLSFLCVVPGLIIELGQLFLLDHVPDITDVFLYACGVVAGMLALRWIAGE